MRHVVSWESPLFPVKLVRIETYPKQRMVRNQPHSSPYRPAARGTAVPQAFRFEGPLSDEDHRQPSQKYDARSGKSTLLPMTEMSTTNIVARNETIDAREPVRMSAVVRPALSIPPEEPVSGRDEGSVLRL